MGPSMSKRDSSRERVDACRPGDEWRDDLRSLELADAVENSEELQGTLERSRAFDRRVSEAIRDVEVPAGLADRLLAQVGMESTVEYAVSEPDVVTDAEGGTVTVVQGRWSQQAGRLRRAGWLQRRSAWAAIGALSSAAAILAILFLGSEGPAEIRTAWEIADAVPNWQTGIDDTAWRALADLQVEDPPPVAVSQLRRWQAIDDEVVVYQLRTGPKDFLFVIPAAETEVYATRPPERPNSYQSGSNGSAGVSVAVWRHRQSVYVLVLDGGPNRYRSLVHPHSTPMAA